MKELSIGKLHILLPVIKREIVLSVADMIADRFTNRMFEGRHSVGFEAFLLVEMIDPIGESRTEEFPFGV